MLDKAVVICSEALDYLRSRFPADDAKYGEFHKACGDMILRINWLKGELADLEHENKSRYNNPCICPRCDTVAGLDKEFMDKCLVDTVREDIDDDVSAHGNPKNTMTLVYDKDVKMDVTDEAFPKGEPVEMLLPVKG